MRSLRAPAAAALLFELGLADRIVIVTGAVVPMDGGANRII